MTTLAPGQPGKAGPHDARLSGRDDLVLAARRADEAAASFVLVGAVSAAGAY